MQSARHLYSYGDDIIGYPLHGEEEHLLAVVGHVATENGMLLPLGGVWAEGVEEDVQVVGGRVEVELGEDLVRGPGEGQSSVREDERERGGRRRRCQVDLMGPLDTHYKDKMYYCFLQWPFYLIASS